MATDAQPLGFFNRAYLAFQQAEQATQLIEYFYHIGGYTILLRFAGPALVPSITPALEHLATSPTKPDLTIHLWDDISTTTQMPAPPWASTDYLVHGYIRGYNNHQIQTVFNPGSGLFSMLNYENNTALYWTRNAKDIPYWERGAPLQVILHSWFRRHHRQFVHGAAVGTAMGGILLAGKGGLGKSTSALACLDSELQYASDDYCLLSTDKKPYIYSLYNSAKLDNDSMQRFPHLISSIQNKDQLSSEKALVFLNQHLPKKVTKGFPAKAILVPRVTGKPETYFTPISSAAMLKALAPSTIFQLLSPHALQTMSQWVQNIPCYTLELGTKITTIPTTILNILNEHST